MTSLAPELFWLFLVSSYICHRNCEHRIKVRTIQGGHTLAALGPLDPARLSAVWKPLSSGGTSPNLRQRAMKHDSLHIFRLLNELIDLPV